MRKKLGFITLLMLVLVFMMACGGGDDVDNNVNGAEDVVENGSSGEVVEGQAGLMDGEFTKATDVLSGSDVEITYQEDLETRTNSMGYPTVDINDDYWVIAQKQGVAYTLEEMKDSLESLYSEYKGYDLYESTYKGHDCLVFMHDKDPDIDSDAGLTIYIYPEDDGMIEISVLSFNGELDFILNDPITMAVVNSVDW